MNRCCWPLATVSGAMHDPATVSANPASLVSGTLADHRIQLTTVTGTPIASNDDWPSNTNAAEMAQLGIAPAHPKEAALLLTLDAGPAPRTPYTPIISGVGGTQGIDLVEVYEVP